MKNVVNGRGQRWLNKLTRPWLSRYKTGRSRVGGLGTDDAADVQQTVGLILLLTLGP